MRDAKVNRKSVILVLAALLIALTFLSVRVDRITAGAVPTTSIVSVTRNASVTVRTYDFPANQNFTVTMGNMGTRGVAGYIIETFNSGAGGSFDKTFTIPAVLHGQAQIAIRMESPQGYFAFDWFNNSDGNVPVAPTPIVPGYSGIPTTTVRNVDPGVSVTLQTHNFPPNQIFVVTMGEFGTRGIGGIKVAEINSGVGGSFLVSFNIPAALKDNSRIAVRLQSAEGFFAFDWFNNKVTAPAPVAPGYSGIPTTTVKSVDPGVSVTLQTHNFPPNQVFVVTMGEFGTRGIGGIKVADTSSGAGGSFEVSYAIPDALKDRELIAIRLESPEGFFAFDWFRNQPAATGTVIPGYTGIPTTTIKSVVPGTSVTVITHNFPPNVDFDITMGNFGTKGVGGTFVKTINSGAGGSFEVTADIPAALAANDRIAIRFQSSGPFFAFDWFFNK